MTAGAAYQFFIDIIKKEINGNIPIPLFERFFNRAQMELMVDYLGEPQEYQPGRPIARINYEASKKIGNAILPFRRVIAVPVNNVGIGQYDPNKDFIYGPTAVAIAWYTNPEDCDDPPPDNHVNEQRQIRWSTDAEWADFTSSTIDFPTLKYPIGRFVSTTLMEISPRSIASVEWTYIRRPKDIFVGRDTVLGRFVLDPNDPNNVDPEWLDIDVNNVIARALFFAGVHLKNDRLLTVAQRKIKEGM